MGEMAEADRYLLEQVRRGSSDGWSQLVGRYHGRLLAFARKQLSDADAAEDAVQETFVSFLKAVKTFRQQSSLETYLFIILRHRIVDSYRSRPVNTCSLQDAISTQDNSESAELRQAIAAPDLTASWYVRRDEAHDRLRTALWSAVRDLIDNLKQTLNFRNLQIAEMIFYAQLRNKTIAAQVGLDEKQVALVKHRFLKRLAMNVSEGDMADDLPDDSMRDAVVAHEALLTQIWEEQRPSCPKRSTIGAYLLGTLDEAWHSYVDFHLNQLGCRLCQANLDDLQDHNGSAQRQVDRARTRIMQSTVGFLPNRN